MSVWLLIAGMFLVTFLPRYVPMALAGRFKISPLLNQALEFVPIAVLTAIIARVSVVHDGETDLQLDNPYLYALFVSFIVARISKNIFITISAGLMVYALVFSLGDILR